MIIVNIQKINIEKLNLTEYNPRKDLKPEDEEYQKIKKSLIEFGYVAPIIVNADMTVIGGHQRLKALKELGYIEIECNVVDLDKTKEKALNIALNKISGEWDNDKLEGLLAELREADFDLEVIGFNFDEINAMLDINEAEEDNFDVEQTLDEIEEPISKQGDIWILGKHRLMCGDSTNEKDVKKLMNKKVANLILTDPPYNVNYEGIAGKIANDNMSETEFYNFLLKSFKNMFDFVKPGGSVYIFHADTEGLNFRKAFKEAGFKLAQCLIWVKNTFVMGRQDYQWRHEPVLYGWKEGIAHYFIDDRTQSTVIEDKHQDFRKLKKEELIKILEETYRERISTTIIEEDKPTINDLHPTMKPIKLLSRLIKNSSRVDECVLDLFGGSGSTLIACEQLSRTCYMMELDPKYCDVIIKRWETLTGKKAELEKK